MEEEKLLEVKEEIHKLMLNTINNLKLPTKEHREGYMKCINDAMQIVERIRNGSKDIS